MPVEIAESEAQQRCQGRTRDLFRAYWDAKDKVNGTGDIQLAGVATPGLWLGRGLTVDIVRSTYARPHLHTSQSSLPRHNERGSDAGQI
jgi:hypothetical protein